MQTTAMRSAPCTVESRCATTSVVRALVYKVVFKTKINEKEN